MSMESKENKLGSERSHSTSIREQVAAADPWRLCVAMKQGIRLCKNDGLRRALKEHFHDWFGGLPCEARGELVRRIMAEREQERVTRLASKARRAS
jgi:hypothetical protein